MMTAPPSSDCALCATGQLIERVVGVGPVGLLPQLPEATAAQASTSRDTTSVERNTHLAAEAAHVAGGGVHFTGSEHHTRLYGQRDEQLPCRQLH